VPRDFERDEAVHEDVGGCPAPGKSQHRRPEQRVEIHDVLADEVVLFDRRIGHELVEALRVAERCRRTGIEVMLQCREIADRRIEPHVEILAWRVRNLDAEVRRVARDIPVVERVLAAIRLAAEPLLDLVEDLGL
jgi:hypothetical protein